MPPPLRQPELGQHRLQLRRRDEPIPVLVEHPERLSHVLLHLVPRIRIHIHLVRSVEEGVAQGRVEDLEVFKAEDFAPRRLHQLALPFPLLLHFRSQMVDPRSQDSRMGLVALLHELNATRSDLFGSKTLAVTNSLLQTLLTEVSCAREDDVAAVDELSRELKLAVGPHKLPLGFTSNLDTDELYPALNAACFKF
ncbi:hypothetical protein Cni_G17458 [Canna indica]|uniref:Uncharacterized protein n=1 Tax=Canna indica TaxID=4628 RepID=A0AAQ3KJ92_9LILI|nr:hypothetical protein Cni_G17458 [Canna indica]